MKFQSSSCIWNLHIWNYNHISQGGNELTAQLTFMNQDIAAVALNYLIFFLTKKQTRNLRSQVFNFLWWILFSIKSTCHWRWQLYINLVVVIKRLKDPPTWLKEATTLEKHPPPPPPTHFHCKGFRQHVPFQLQKTIEKTNLCFFGQKSAHQYLTHCGLVIPYNDRDLGQHWLK